MYVRVAGHHIPKEQYEQFLRVIGRGIFGTYPFGIEWCLLPEGMALNYDFGCEKRGLWLKGFDGWNLSPEVGVEIVEFDQFPPTEKRIVLL